MERGAVLGRFPPAEVEADRTPEPGQVVVAHAGFAKARPAIGLRLAAANGPDVAAAAAEGLDDRRLVELDVVGEHGNRVVRTESDLLGPLVRPADHEPIHPVRW